MMNYEEHYDSHDMTFHDFSDKINAISKQYNIHVLFNNLETFGNDGSVAYSDKVTIFGLDWEQRQQYYPSFGKFKFYRWGLSQYGSKIYKDEKIDLSLQMSTDGTGLFIAWHDDFVFSKTITLSSNTKENRTEDVYITQKYKEFDLTKEESYVEIVEILKRAVDVSKRNYKSFTA